MENHVANQFRCSVLSQRLNHLESEEYIVYVSWVRFMFCHLPQCFTFFSKTGLNQRTHLRHSVTKLEPLTNFQGEKL